VSAKEPPPPSAADRRQQRLAAALRANLKRRKAQVRAREAVANAPPDAPAADDREE
jgi:hypothetical protein